MLIKKLQDCKEFVAGDNTVLRELLHPDKADVKCRYSFAPATIKSGKSSTPHSLKTSEVYYILEGEGVMHIGNESFQVSKNQLVYIPPNSKQYITNSGAIDLKFICIVDPAWNVKDEMILNQI
jgi:mannose-6-phosphate isomerase-like protein (cupin superfamily)